MHIPTYMRIKATHSQPHEGKKRPILTQIKERTAHSHSSEKLCIPTQMKWKEMKGCPIPPK